MRTQVAIFGGQRYDDLPQHANIMNTTMQHGDVLVLSTDGVLDNLNNQEILKMVSTRMMAKKAWIGRPDKGISVSDQFDALTRRDPSSTSPEPASSTSFVAPGRDIKNSEYTLQELLASNITRRAKLASLDLRRDGPFAKEALRQFPNEPFHGGKVDDITVVVVIAVEEGRAERANSEESSRA
jgi:protein phosphatase PTC7